MLADSAGRDEDTPPCFGAPILRALAPPFFCGPGKKPSAFHRVVPPAKGAEAGLALAAWREGKWWG